LFTLQLIIIPMVVFQVGKVISDGVERKRIRRKYNNIDRTA